tara:strand:+ start:518 stop:1108 length:591 start_codon:yes stop_codon:yes gene_type:complete
MIELSQIDVLQFNKDMETLIKSVSDSNKIREAFKPGAEIVKGRAKALSPVAKPRKRDNTINRYFAPKKLRSDVLYTYKSPKVAGNKRAGKGFGRVSGKYGLGNIKSSIQIISDVKGYKAPIALIGPVINRKTSVPNPNEKRHNGWYAHIIYGSAKAFGEKVTVKALRQTQSLVMASIRVEVNKILDATKTKLKKVA